MNVIVCLITLILCIPNCNSYHIQMNSIVWCMAFCNNRVLYVQYLFQNQSFNHIELSHKVVVSTRALNTEFEPQQCILFTQYNSTHTLTAQNSHRLSLYCIFFAPFISTLWIRRRQAQSLVLSKKWSMWVWYYWFSSRAPRFCACDMQEPEKTVSMIRIQPSC